jgi:hypothetical protein
VWSVSIRISAELQGRDFASFVTSASLGFRERRHIKAAVLKGKMQVMGPVRDGGRWLPKE